MIPKNYQVQQGGNSEGFEPLPADTYQVEIEDVELKQDVPVYKKPDETEDRFSFKFRVVDESEWNGRYLWKEMRPVMSAGSGTYDPSILYKIYCAVHNIKPGELSEDEVKSVGGDKVNDMVSKQVRIVVDQKANTKGEIKNRITGFLPLKVKAIPKKAEPSEIIIDKDYLPF